VFREHSQNWVNQLGTEKDEELAKLHQQIITKAGQLI